MKELLLTKNKIAFVDDEDYYWVSQWNWFAVEISGNWYARRSKKKGVLRNAESFEIYLHRVVMKCNDKTKVVDHINGDALNNQKHNLRICTKAENNRNTTSHKNSKSKYLGVSFSAEAYRNCKWIAQLRHKGQIILHRYYHTEREAAQAYDIAAKETYGTFANLNYKKNLQNKSLKELLSVTNRPLMSNEHKILLRKSRESIDFTKLHREKRGRKVIDIKTGEIYSSLAEVCEIIGMSKGNLSRMLLGKRNNKTDYKYLD